MIARYNSTCPVCHEPIVAGRSSIRKVHGRWEHVACWDSNEDFNARWAEAKNEAARMEAEQERAAYLAEMREEEREYGAGLTDYRRWKMNVELFGEDYAAQEELAWELRDPAY